MTSIYLTFIDNQATLINSDHLQTLWMWKLAFLSVTYEDDNSIMKHVTGSEMILCETQWNRPPSFSPSWLIQWSMGEGSYITLFSPSDVTAFHRIKYGGGVLHNLVFTKGRHCFSQNSGYITTVPPLKWRSEHISKGQSLPLLWWLVASSLVPCLLDFFLPLLVQSPTSPGEKREAL